MNVDGLDLVGPWIFIQLAKPMLVVSVTHAEFLALREGFLIAVSSRWVVNNSSMFKLDYCNMVKWFRNMFEASWQFQHEIQNILKVFGFSLHWSIVHTRIQTMKQQTCWLG